MPHRRQGPGRGAPYIGPLLHARTGLGASAITLVLLGFGLAGAAGNFTAGVTVRRHLRATPMGSGLLVAVSALLLAAVTGARPLTIALVAVWGLGFGARKRPHRRQARPIKQETAHNEHAEVRGHTEAVTTGRNCHA